MPTGLEFSSLSPTLLPIKYSAMKGRQLILLTLILLSYQTLPAQKCFIQGQFLYSAEEEYSYGIYDHPLLQDQFPVMGEGRSDAEGKFSFDLNIVKPQILQLKRRADVYRVYIQPGDTLSLKILNRFNIEFAGDSRRENELLFQMEFHQAFYAGDPLEDCLLALDTLGANRQALIQQYKQEPTLVNEDFLRYLEAAVIGHRYDKLNQVYHRHVREQPENPLLGVVSNDLLSLPAHNEIRSVVYLNAMAALLQNSLDQKLAIDPILKEKEALQWGERRKILDTFTAGSPALKRHMDFFLLGMELWWVEEEKELAQFETAWSEMKKRYPEDSLHALFSELYLQRRSAALLKSLEDIRMLDSIGQKVLLSELEQFPVLVLLWSDTATIKNDLERFTSMLPPQWKREQLVTLYMGEEEDLWQTALEDFREQDKGRHFRMPSGAIRDFKTTYKIETAPIYLLFDAPKSLQQVSFELTQRIYRALFSLGRSR